MQARPASFAASAPLLLAQACWPSVRRVPQVPQVTRTWMPRVQRGGPHEDQRARLLLALRPATSELRA
jgi:hypothetical protein